MEVLRVRSAAARPERRIRAASAPCPAGKAAGPVPTHSPSPRRIVPGAHLGEREAGGDAVAVTIADRACRAGSGRNAGHERDQRSRRSRGKSGSARFAVVADISVIAARAVGHFRVARRAADQRNQFLATVAVRRIDRPRTALAARRHIRGHATLAADGWDLPGCAAHRRCDRDDDDLLALTLVRAAWRLPGRTTDAGRGHLAGEATGFSDQHVALPAVGCRRR